MRLDQLRFFLLRGPMFYNLRCKRRFAAEWATTEGVRMRRFALVFLSVLMIFALAAPAYADQPSQGHENSDGRNGGVTTPGPHCHINTRASGGPHGDILVGVIHGGGHVSTNTAIGGNAVFMAIDCRF